MRNFITQILLQIVAYLFLLNLGCGVLLSCFIAAVFTIVTTPLWATFPKLPEDKK